MARDYRPKRNKPGAFPGWIGLACGLGLGLGVAAVVCLKDHRLDAPAASAGKIAKKKIHGNEASDAGGTGTDDSKSYDFYEMLPKFEVVVQRTIIRPDIKPVPDIRHYMLQAGSYKNFADADRVHILFGAGA